MAREHGADFPSRVAEELSAARATHGPIHSLHEGYAVILEELDEVWAAIRSKPLHGHDVLIELVQVAAMCQRLAEDVLLLPPPPMNGPRPLQERRNHA